MGITVIIAYALIIAGIAVWGVLLTGRRKISRQSLQYISVFGGAFLLASCFVNLVPHIFVGQGFEQFVVGRAHFKVAAAVLVGFLLQMLLELLTHGLEHEHKHSATTLPLWSLMTGLCVHGFLEGMPLVGADGDLHQGLLYGIVLHNIPIAIVLVTLFMQQGLSTRRSMMMLLFFGVTTPLGSLFNLYLLPSDALLQRLIMGIVVGILLHVSVSILFDQESDRRPWLSITLTLIAFVAAYFTPGCPEIYPLN